MTTGKETMSEGTDAMPVGIASTDQLGRGGNVPRWWHCDTHGPGTHNAWGCPECVREMRAEIARLKAGHDRYEVVRRMNVQQFQAAYVLNRRTGKPFDEIVSDLAPFFGLRVRA